ncbi:MAG: DNA repair protein RadA, partial [Oscillospiraceae bacterium]|nr:DNA repair protein RadA [Oscillospiraceae bacterium]
MTSKSEKLLYVCSECGSQSKKWIGKCPDCGSWNTMFEEVIIENSKNSKN